MLSSLGPMNIKLPRSVRRYYLWVKGFRKVMRSAMFATVAAITAIVLGQPSQSIPLPVLQNNLDKKTIASVSGNFKVTITPEETGGTGAAAYVMRHLGKIVWRKRLPFFYYDLVIGNTGAMIGYCETPYTVSIWHVSKDGIPKRYISYERKGDGSDAAARPIGATCVKFDIQDSALIEIDGVPAKGKRYGPNSYRLFDITSGKLKKQWSDPALPASEYEEWTSIPRTELVALISLNGHALTASLIDSELHIVAKHVVQLRTNWYSEFPLAPDDQTVVVPCDTPAHFAVRATKDRLEFAVHPRQGKWELREVRRQAYDPILRRRAAILKSPVVNLPVAKRVTLRVSDHKFTEDYNFEVSDYGTFYVADRTNQRLLKFDSQGSQEYEFDLKGADYDEPVVTVNRDGSAWFGSQEVGYFIVSKDGQASKEWKPPIFPNGLGSLEAADGLRWVSNYWTLCLTKADGTILKSYKYRPDGGLVDVPEEFATSADGSMCMLCRPEPEVALALPGDPAHLCFYDPKGKEKGCIRLPEGNHFDLEGYDGQRLFLSAPNEIVCFNLQGKPLWRVNTSLFKDAPPHFVTRDGKYLMFGRGNKMTFYRLPTGVG